MDGTGPGTCGGPRGTNGNRYFVLLGVVAALLVYAALQLWANVGSKLTDSEGSADPRTVWTLELSSFAAWCIVVLLLWRAIPHMLPPRRREGDEAAATAAGEEERGSSSSRRRGRQGGTRRRGAFLLPLCLLPPRSGRGSSGQRQRLRPSCLVLFAVLLLLLLLFLLLLLRIVRAVRT